MSLVPGTRLGPYEIVAPLGAGGMGEVYRARDTRLGREVAIKIMPDAVANDVERIARFEREARLLASLHHPNIAAIHGLENVGGQRFIVMECVEGVSLADRLSTGPMPVPEALEIGRQIALALEAAHEGGVVHRDLKPGNVQITPAGEVRVLDFGLAKGDVASSSSSDLTHSPTLTGAMTGIGMILGTAAYMSPEQARGKPVDRRTDIWSFGAVLFECLSGRQCFGGETLSDTIAMILQRDPEWALLPRTTPGRIRRLLARCLERDPRKRLRDIGEARIELEASIASLASGELPAEDRADALPAGSRSRGIALGLAAGAVIGLAIGIALMVARSHGTGASVPVIRYSVRVPAGQRMLLEDFTVDPDWDVSPDGSVVAARLPRLNEQTGALLVGTNNAAIFVCRLADGIWRRIPGSERASGTVTFMPDSRSLYFPANVSEDSGDQRLMRASVDEGSVATAVCDLPDDAASARLLPDGRVVMGSFAGTRIAIREPGNAGAPTWRPVHSPHSAGIDLLATAVGSQLSDHEWFVGFTTYARDGWHRGTAILDLKTLDVVPVLTDGQWPVLLRSGHLCFTRGTALMAVRFDRGRRRTVGEAVPVLDGLRTRGAWLPARFRLTSAGDLFYAPHGAVGEQRSLELVDARGGHAPFSTVRRAFTTSVGADALGRHVAIGVTNARGLDEIWTFEGEDREGQPAIRLEAADAGSPVLSPDARFIAFSRIGTDSLNGVYVSPFRAESAPRPVLLRAQRDTTYRALAWLPDSRHLLCRGLSGGGHRFTVILDTAPGGAMSPPDPRYHMFNASISPDGRFVAFDSDHLGRDRIFVAPISSEQGVGSAVAVTQAGVAPAWSTNGRSVYYADTTTYRLVHVATAGGISASAPQTLFQIDFDPERITGGIDLADGRELLVLRSVEDLEATELEVVQNWVRSVAAKLPR